MNRYRFRVNENGIHDVEAESEQAAKQVMRDSRFSMYQYLGPWYRCADPKCPGYPYRASEIRHPCKC